MANSVKRDDIDWTLIAENVLMMRQMQKMTQVQLAERAGLAVATLNNAERGHRLSLRTLKKIASGLNMDLSGLCYDRRPVPEGDRAFVLHRASDKIWSTLGDKRPHVPPEDRSIRDPVEQRRIASVGFVAGFMHTTSFVMPDGPGVVFIDLYRIHEGNINETVYKDALLYCVEGHAIVGVQNESVVLSEGDVIGICPKDIKFMAPGPQMTPQTLPVRLMWIGGNRLGKVPLPPKRRKARKT